MEKDKFDDMIVEIESKSSEIAMLMSCFVLEILETYSEMKTDVHAEFPFFDPEAGYRSINSRSVFFDPCSSRIIIETDELLTPVMWDDLSAAAKEIIINELHHKHKSSKIYRSFSDKHETH